MPNTVSIRHSLQFAIDKISSDEKVASLLHHILINAKFQFETRHLMKFPLFLRISLFSLSEPENRSSHVWSVEAKGKSEWKKREKLESDPLTKLYNSQKEVNHSSEKLNLSLFETYAFDRLFHLLSEIWENFTFYFLN